jgi:hypothetical protein
LPWIRGHHFDRRLLGGQAHQFRDFKLAFFENVEQIVRQIDIAFVELVDQ